MANYKGRKLIYIVVVRRLRGILDSFG